MKTKVLILFTCLSVSWSVFSQSTAMDRLAAYYKETALNLQKNIENLAEVQLQFKPSEESWSISQCVEHIIATEVMIFDMIKGYMEQPENTALRSEIKFSDKDIIDMMVDRSQKFQAPEVLQKEGIYTNAKEALKDFDTQRSIIMDYLASVDEEGLRNRVNSSPAGMVDVYQNLLFLAAHTTRHTLQIEEIKNHPDFPKS